MIVLFSVGSMTVFNVPSVKLSSRTSRPMTATILGSCIARLILDALTLNVPKVRLGYKKINEKHSTLKKFVHFSDKYNKYC